MEKIFDSRLGGQWGYATRSNTEQNRIKMKKEASASFFIFMPRLFLLSSRSQLGLTGDADFS